MTQGLSDIRAMFGAWVVLVEMHAGAGPHGLEVELHCVDMVLKLRKEKRDDSVLVALLIDITDGLVGREEEKTTPSLLSQLILWASVITRGHDAVFPDNARS